MAEHRRLLVWWLTSAGILLVILIAVAGYFVASTVGPLIQAHRSGCLPSDFPIYAHATIIEVDLSFDATPNGDTTQCRMRLSVAAEYESVNNFYRSRLNSGDWWYSSYFEDVSGALVAFSRRSRALTKGTMTIHKQARGTPFEVELAS